MRAIPVVEPTYDHLVGMATALGVFEHSRGSRADHRHGYCLDDVGRALGVVAREPEPEDALLALAHTCLGYTERAVRRDGAAHNRLSASGRWTDRPFVGDHWGRAVWGLGQLVASPWTPGEVADRAAAVLNRALLGRCRWPRAMAYAAVGAADALAARPQDRRAIGLLLATRPLLEAMPLPAHPGTVGWTSGAIRAEAGALGGWAGRSSLAAGAGRAMLPVGQAWPQPRLTYANALIPEALIAIGVGLGDATSLDRGLALLRWLVALQTSPEGHLSPVPAHGWAPGEALPAFDQQPIEVVALAESCWRALRATDDPAWLEPLMRCRDWFLGANDAGLRLYDSRTGAGHDGLAADHVNANQGAESTMAALSTLQLARIAEQGRGLPRVPEAARGATDRAGGPAPAG